MDTLPEAVTFDFHNTIAICDEWFRLEVHDLLPAFMRWHNAHTSQEPIGIGEDQAIAAYRRIRHDIMNNGLEKDAATCVDEVLQEFGFDLDHEHVCHGVETIMRATLCGSRPSPGIPESVRKLKSSGVSLGVVSSAAYHPFLEWSLEKFRIGHAFDSIVTSASCGYYKSRTEIYEIAVSSLRVDPTRSVHIGDSERFDVITAAQIGMATILYDPERTSAESSAADAVIHSFDDIDLVIADVFRRRLS